MNLNTLNALQGVVTGPFPSTCKGGERGSEEVREEKFNQSITIYETPSKETSMEIPQILELAPPLYKHPYPIGQNLK